MVLSSVLNLILTQILTLTVTLTIGTAAAGSSNASECLDCCRDAGASTCATEIYVAGDATEISAISSGWRAKGMYVVSCDGRGYFDDERTALFPRAPSAGDAAPSSSGQWSCFEQSCQLPTNLCFDGTTGRVTLCDSGVIPNAASFRAAPGPKRSSAVRQGPTTARPSAAPTTLAGAPTTPPTTAYLAPGALTIVVAGKPLAVEIARPERAPPEPSAPVWGPAPVAPVAPVAPKPPAPKPTGSILFDDLDDEDILAELRSGGDPSTVQPRVPAPTPDAAWSSGTPAASAAPWQAPAVKPAAIAQLTDGLPRDPPSACEAPMEALRGEARKQVMAGDDLRMAKDGDGAVQKYRAALSMDSCNGYAWLGLGEAALTLKRPDIAIRPLRNATTLMPKHYGAWTELGESYEAIGQNTQAVDAYREALNVKPGHPGAMSGLTRLGAQ